MKRFIVNILLFFAIVCIIDCCVGAVGGYLQKHSTSEFNNLVQHDTHDVLILGSSRAHHHYDTPFLSDTLGLDIYNAGYDGNGVVLAEGILEMIMMRYKPELVLFDIEPAFDIFQYANDNNHIRYISQLKPYYKEAGVSDVIKDVSIDEWRKVHVGMLRYNTSILALVFNHIRQCRSDNKGYAPLDGAMIAEPDKNTEQQRVLDNFKLEYVQKLIRLCQTNNVPLVFVASPKYGKTNSSDLQAVIDIAFENKIPFLDYYAEPSFMEHKEWFREPMHLNREGARVYSRIIAKDIKSLQTYDSH